MGSSDGTDTTARPVACVAGWSLCQSGEATESEGGKRAKEQGFSLRAREKLRKAASQTHDRWLVATVMNLNVNHVAGPGTSTVPRWFH